ncbi:MAG: LysR family transcriptional regulator [Paracoccaceae bacterium]|jgi:DNA-binding transcriptional LysR family regulator|nr:LysR family transcriptional regulator [Paracoccaceae bacterium]MDP7185342.1 LysR family transcriptional regulator [Paracoccaceae bacterium]
MQIEAVQTFLTIARLGGFHAAARQLNLTQTAVSARIRVLEQSLGSVLFDRGPSGARLTAAGRQFRPYAEQLVRTWESAASGLSGRYHARSSLRLGVQLSIWDPVLVDLAIWLEQARGKLPMTLNYDHTLDMVDAVQQHLVDVALVNQPPQGAEVEAVALQPEVLELVSNRPMALGEGDPLFINLDLGHQYAAQWQGIIPLQMRQQIVLGGAQMGLRYLKMRGGIGFFPRAMIKGDLASGHLFKVDQAPSIRLDCLAVYRREAETEEQIAEVLTGLRHIR